MIRRRVSSGIGAATLLFVGSPAFAAPPDAAATDSTAIRRAASRPRLYASILPQAGARGLAAGGEALLRAGKGMIEIIPFGDGFHLAARDRPDRGPERSGARNWSSLRTASARGATFEENLETLGGRRFVRKFAPSVMLGYGQSPERGLGFALEAGMILRDRLASPLAGLSRTTVLRAGERDRGNGAGLLQARIGYRF